MEEEEKPTNVVNLMDALRKSLGGKGGKSRSEDKAVAKVVPFRKPAAGGKAKPKVKARAKPAARPAARRR